MQSQPPPAPPRKSAFAAAFFSFLFPGLGHAYLGSWSRALAWAALPILAVALGAGFLVNPAIRLVPIYRLGYLAASMFRSLQ